MNNKERMQIIANNITIYRKAKGITQKELASAIGISQSTMTDYMKLRTAPSWGVIQKLADYFGVKKSDIDTTFKQKESKQDKTIAEIISLLKHLDEDTQENILNFVKFEYTKAEQAKQLEENDASVS
jgi:transcriptional regulator with XRE-family HTH domain